MDTSVNRLDAIFKELKNDGLINPKRKLKETMFTSQIQGIFKQIRYNKKFYIQHLSKLDNNQLKFVLLHEEGHIVKGSLKEYIWIFLFILGGIFLFKWPIHGFFDFIFIFNGQSYSISNLGSSITQIFTMVIYILIFFPLLYRLFYELMFNAEFSADEYAANGLKSRYGIEHPSSVMKDTLEHILSQYNFRIKERIFLVIYQVVGLYPGYHPSITERVQNIINKFE